MRQRPSGPRRGSPALWRSVAHELRPKPHTSLDQASMSRTNHELLSESNAKRPGISGPEPASRSRPRRGWTEKNRTSDPFEPNFGVALTDRTADPSDSMSNDGEPPQGEPTTYSALTTDRLDLRRGPFHLRRYASERASSALRPVTEDGSGLVEVPWAFGEMFRLAKGHVLLGVHAVVIGFPVAVPAAVITEPGPGQSPLPPSTSIGAPQPFRC